METGAELCGAAEKDAETTGGEPGNAARAVVASRLAASAEGQFQDERSTSTGLSSLDPRPLPSSAAYIDPGAWSVLIGPIGKE